VYIVGTVSTLRQTVIINDLLLNGVIQYGFYGDYRMRTISVSIFNI